jgi:hypothetical protein
MYPYHIKIYFNAYCRQYIQCYIKKNIQKLRGLSLQANYIPTEQPPLVSKVSANFFADRGCHVVSVTNPYDRILGFLVQSRYFFFQVAPQLYSRGWVDPVPDPLLFFLVVPGNRTRDLRICSQELLPLDHRGGHIQKYILLIIYWFIVTYLIYFSCWL